MAGRGNGLSSGVSKNFKQIAIVEAGIIVTLVATVIFYIAKTKPEDHYFLQRGDGRIVQLAPLDQANMNYSALVKWATYAASQAMTFGYRDYQQQLQSRVDLFTPYGWATFTDAIVKSGIIKSITASKQDVSASQRSSPRIVEMAVSNGRWYWVMKLPLKVVYRTQSKEAHSDNLDLTLRIVRVSPEENIDGVEIGRWMITPSDAAN